MEAKSKLKSDLKTVRKMLCYFDGDYKKNGHQWHEGFKAYVVKRIESLRAEESDLKQKLGYA